MVSSMFALFLLPHKSRGQREAAQVGKSEQRSSQASKLKFFYNELQANLPRLCPERRHYYTAQ